MSKKNTLSIRKEFYYFSHDSNAKDDPKCVLLIEQLGLEGYGIFWVLVEVLRDQPDFKYPLRLVHALARRYNTSSEKIKTIITSYGLFRIENEEFFFSESLNRRMQIYIDKKKALSEAGKRGNAKRWIAKRSPGDNKAIAIKEKEIKESTLSESNRTERESLLNSFPPKDGISRNWEGLKRQLSVMRGEVKDKNEIIQLSNYGEIGNPIWTILQEIQNSNGKIHSPILFILSKFEK